MDRDRGNGAVHARRDALDPVVVVCVAVNKTRKWNRVILPSIRGKIDRPLDEKLKETNNIIQHHFEPNHFPIEQQAIGWSGGKDSTVVLFLVREFNPNISVVFNNTGVEYPDTIKFVHETAEKYHINLIEVRYSDFSFWDCVKKWGYPQGKTNRSDHHANKCCYYLKEKPMHHAIREHGWKCIYDGITATENRNRMLQASTRGVCYHHQKWDCCKVHPILWWTEQDVWDYIKANKIPYNPIYDKGADRCGCMPCTAFVIWKEQLQQTAPKMYRKIMRDMGQELIS